MTDALLDHLKEITGPKGWLLPDEAPRYFEDPRQRFQGSAALVVRPKTTAEVSRIVAACNADGTGIVPFGAGTGGTAGHMETSGGAPVVMSLERMNTIRSVSADDDCIVAEAGCILASVQDAAESIGRRFGLSLASEGSCTIGGNLASNAGGIQVLRYGNARDLCLGVEAVLPDGTVLNDLRPLRKNNTGYDLRHLLIGSEGTLGVITAAALKLAPKPRESATMMCAVASPSAALALLHHLRDQLGETVTAFELMSRLGVELATRHFPALRDPFTGSHPWYVIAEIEGNRGIRTELETELERAFEAETVQDAVLAASEGQRQALWNLRENAFEYNTKEGAICSSDTSVPIGQIGVFIARTDAALVELGLGLRANSYGHIGDGNIHVNIFPPEGTDKPAFLATHPQIRDTLRMLINEVTEACGGSISAEHGIGRLKLDDLQRYADPGKLMMMRAVKQAVDPKGIMNPGALFAAT